jgi:hypothetical protein
MKIRLLDQKILIPLTLAISFCFIGIVFFYYPSFFKEGRLIYQRYLPENEWLGNDFYIDYNFSHRYFIEHKSAYITDDPDQWYAGNPYPPGFTYILYPLSLFNITKEMGYQILALIIFFIFFFQIIVFPFIRQGNLQISSTQLFILITGLFSYGMQFTLERGQFDIVAMFFGICAVFIFWYAPKLRILSYLLLVIAFQFKIYPFYLVLCMIDDIRHPLKSLLRVGLISLVCYLSLFVMGVKGYQEFLQSLTSQTGIIPYSKDHSILYGMSFILKESGLPSNLRVAVYCSLPLLAIIGISFIYLIKPYFRNNKSMSFYPPLILWCTLAAMVIFSASKDYKLVILQAPMAYYIIYLEDSLTIYRIRNIPVFVLSFFLQAICYCATLFSYVYRPDILQNSMPFLSLLMILIPLTVASISEDKINESTDKSQAKIGDSQNRNGLFTEECSIRSR